MSSADRCFVCNRPLMPDGMEIAGLRICAVCLRDLIEYVAGQYKEQCRKEPVCGACLYFDREAALCAAPLPSVVRQYLVNAGKLPAARHVMSGAGFAKECPVFHNRLDHKEHENIAGD